MLFGCETPVALNVVSSHFLKIFLWLMSFRVLSLSFFGPECRFIGYGIVHALELGLFYPKFM